jgi:hypothetical protein
MQGPGEERLLREVDLRGMEFKVVLWGAGWGGVGVGWGGVGWGGGGGVEWVVG